MRRIPPVAIPWLIAVAFLATYLVILEDRVAAVIASFLWFWTAGVVTFIVWRRNVSANDTARRPTEPPASVEAPREDPLEYLDHPPGWQKGVANLNLPPFP